ncbi:MAG: site-specific integrase [Pseudolabrys sp.]|nr:site-specific integrase [Pseudolabrys sp.]MDP2296871.1 site-specific integrase [Pseudolabrys sp.]
MATIRQKGPEQWHAQVRRTGWPPITETLRTRKDAETWARDVESQMDRGIFVDRSAAERTTFGERIEIYKKEVTAKRPGAASRAAETSRLNRFMRDEPKLCAYAVAHLRPEHFEEYRDRRLTQIVTRGKPGGRGRYKPEKIKPGRVRKDGTPRANAAQPKAPSKPAKTVEPGTVKRELTLLKRVLDYKKRKLGLLINPANTEDVKRPVVNDERDVRLEDAQIDELIAECYRSKNPWVGPIVEFAFEVGPRRGNLLRLNWKDVDLKERSVLLRGVKNSRNPEEILDVPVGLSPRALEILKALPRSLNGLVFPLSANALKSAFNRARHKLGLDHYRFHDIRHELISSLIEAGWSDTQVMAQSAHRDPKSLKRYTNLRKKHLADALAAIPSRRSKKR